MWAYLNFFNSCTTVVRSPSLSGASVTASDLGGDRLRGLRHRTAVLGKRHGTAAAILRIVDGGDKAARNEPVDDSLDGGGVEVDAAAEMVLRTGADVVQLGEPANWVWVRPSIMRLVKIAMCRCMATRNRNPT